MLIAVLVRVGSPAGLFGCAGWAYVAALERKGRRPGRDTFDGAVTVLGEEIEPIPCRVLRASRSVVRFAVPNRLPKLGQIQVEMGNEFFVGSIRCVVANDRGFVLELEVVGSNYTPLRLGARLLHLCGGACDAIERQLVLTLHYLAVDLLGARLRWRASAHSAMDFGDGLMSLTW